MTPNNTPNYTQFVKHPKTHPITPIIEILQPQPRGVRSLENGHLQVAYSAEILTMRSKIHRATLSKTALRKKLMLAFSKASNID
jgi:hypothetical protein